MFDTINKTSNNSEPQDDYDINTNQDDASTLTTDPIQAPEAAPALDNTTQETPMQAQEVTQGPVPISAFDNKKYEQVEDIFSEIDESSQPKDVKSNLPGVKKRKMSFKKPIIIIFILGLLLGLSYVFYSIDGMSTEKVKTYLAKFELNKIMDYINDKRGAVKEKISGIGGEGEANGTNQGMQPGQNNDTDGDKLIDSREVELGTDINLPDTDGDRLSDYDEVTTYNTDPLKEDTDGDGLKDNEEVTVLKTSALNPDTDGDGLGDNEEINKYNTDATIVDTDNDGLTDNDEITTHNTDPLKNDTDRDGIKDSDEVNIHKTNPLSNDTDSDGLIDNDELVVYNTNPLIADTDEDGLNDNEEINTYETDPLNNDSDKDGYLDGEEINAGYNPLGEGKLEIKVDNNLEPETK